MTLSNATLLNYPQHDSPTALLVDASNKFCGTILNHIASSGSHRLLEYFSAAFSDTLKRYSILIKNCWQLTWQYITPHT